MQQRKNSEKRKNEKLEMKKLPSQPE